MFWKRLSVSCKLFAVMFGVTALVIAFVSVFAVLNMRQGFALYLAEAELARFDSLEVALIGAHDPNNPGWPELKGNRPAWNSFVRTALPPPRRSVDPQLDGRDVATLEVRRPPPPDPLRLGIRLTLLNADGERIVGGNTERDVFAKRPILLPQADNEGRPLGWIGLTGGAEEFAAGDQLFLNNQLRTLGLTALFALLLSAIGAYVLARQLLKPVRDVAAAGNHLAAGDYTIRLVHERKDELGAMLDQFNELAQNLGHTDAVQRRWVSDTSHELITPLAVLQGQIEALQDGVRKPNVETFEQLHASVSRLSRLVADLNLLANAHEEQLWIAPTSESLSAIINDAVEALANQANEAQLEFQIDVPSDLIVICDRLRLRQLIDNLLQNTIRYTSPPGEIKITGRSLRDHAEIAFEDSAPCPPDETLDRLFDRFYRVEDSRNRKHGGSGLGLSICREIIRAHGGTINAEKSSLDGLKIVATLPINGA